jgi:hypothetical protein
MQPGECWNRRNGTLARRVALQRLGTPAVPSMLALMDDDSDGTLDKQPPAPSVSERSAGRYRFGFRFRLHVPSLTPDIRLQGASPLPFSRIKSNCGWEDRGGDFGHAPTTGSDGNIEKKTCRASSTPQP